MVEYRELGRSGIRVSAVGIGTWQWGSRIWGYSKTYGDRELRKAFGRALELGINFFDTAEIYGGGRSELLLGEFLKDFRRDDVVIATKFSPTRLTERGIRKALEGSLRRLGTSYVDLYQVHWPNILTPISETMKVLEKLWKEGKIMAIGVSNFSLRQLEKAREALSSVDIASNQVEYNMLRRRAEKGLLEYCVREKIALIAYSPLAQGALTGKYSPSSKPGDLVRALNPYFSSRKLREIQPLIGALREIAERRGKTVAQVSLNWILRWPNTIPIPGVKRAEQVDDIAGAMSFRLSQEELELIEEKLKSSGGGRSGRISRALHLLKSYISMKLYER